MQTVNLKKSCKIFLIKNQINWGDIKYQRENLIASLKHAVRFISIDVDQLLSKLFLMLPA